MKPAEPVGIFPAPSFGVVAIPVVVQAVAPAAVVGSRTTVPAVRRFPLTISSLVQLRAVVPVVVPPSCAVVAASAVVTSAIVVPTVVVAAGVVPLVVVVAPFFVERC